MRKFLFPIIVFGVLLAIGASVEWMYNPFTATGDLVYRNSGGQPAALPIGTNTYVLTSNGTVPTWAAAGGGGSAKQIFDITPDANNTQWGNAVALNGNLGATTSTSSIANYNCSAPGAGTFKNLYVKFDANSTGSEVLTLLKNNSATTITVNVGSGSNNGKDATHTATSVDGDIWSVKWTGDNTPSHFVAYIEFDPN